MSISKADFKKLQALWYKKAEESGYKDIEYKNGSMSASHLRSPRQKHAVYRESIAEYYSMCYHFLNEYAFENEVEKVIWEYHTERISARNIALLLQKAGIRKKRKTAVWQIIKALEAKMKAKYLRP